MSGRIRKRKKNKKMKEKENIHLYDMMVINEKYVF